MNMMRLLHVCVEMVEQVHTRRWRIIRRCVRVRRRRRVRRAVEQQALRRPRDTPAVPICIRRPETHDRILMRRVRVLQTALLLYGQLVNLLPIASSGTAVRRLVPIRTFTALICRTYIPHYIPSINNILTIYISVVVADVVSFLSIYLSGIG